eukprot:scpid29098/ scgid2823/ 
MDMRLAIILILVVGAVHTQQQHFVTTSQQGSHRQPIPCSVQPNHQVAVNDIGIVYATTEDTQYIWQLLTRNTSFVSVKFQVENECDMVMDRVNFVLQKHSSCSLEYEIERGLIQRQFENLSRFDWNSTCYDGHSCNHSFSVRRFSEKYTNQQHGPSSLTVTFSSTDIPGTFCSISASTNPSHPQQSTPRLQLFMTYVHTELPGTTSSDATKVEPTLDAAVTDTAEKAGKSSPGAGTTLENSTTELLPTPTGTTVTDSNDEPITSKVMPALHDSTEFIITSAERQSKTKKESTQSTLPDTKPVTNPTETARNDTILSASHTSSSATHSPTADSTEPRSPSVTGELVGAITAAIIILSLVIVVTVICWRRRQSKNTMQGFQRRDGRAQSITNPHYCDVTVPECREEYSLSVEPSGEYSMAGPCTMSNQEPVTSSQPGDKTLLNRDVVPDNDTTQDLSAGYSLTGPSTHAQSHSENDAATYDIPHKNRKSDEPTIENLEPDYDHLQHPNSAANTKYPGPGKGGIHVNTEKSSTAQCKGDDGKLLEAETSLSDPSATVPSNITVNDTSIQDEPGQHDTTAVKPHTLTNHPRRNEPKDASQLDQPSPQSLIESIEMAGLTNDIPHTPSEIAEEGEEVVGSEYDTIQCSRPNDASTNSAGNRKGHTSSSRSDSTPQFGDSNSGKTAERTTQLSMGGGNLTSDLSSGIQQQPDCMGHMYDHPGSPQSTFVISSRAQDTKSASPDSRCGPTQIEPEPKHGTLSSYGATQEPPISHYASVTGLADAFDKPTESTASGVATENEYAAPQPLLGSKTYFAQSDYETPADV